MPKNVHSLIKPLSDSTIEKDRFEIVKLVDEKTQRKAESLVDRFPKSYGNKSFQFIVFGGSEGQIKIIDNLPPEIHEIVLGHLEKLKQYFQARFPNKSFDFLEAEVRISNDGSFDVSHLHMDFGGFGNTISTSTTFNTTGIGTYVGRKETVVTTDTSTTLLPLEYRDNDNSWNQIPNFGIPVTSLQQTQVGETLIIQRVPNGLINSKSALVGKKGFEKQKLAVESGVWHASPGLLLSEAMAHPRRFWIGVIATFY